MFFLLLFQLFIKLILKLFLQQELSLSFLMIFFIRFLISIILTIVFKIIIIMEITGAFLLGLICRKCRFLFNKWHILTCTAFALITDVALIVFVSDLLNLIFKVFIIFIIILIVRVIQTFALRNDFFLFQIILLNLKGWFLFFNLFLVILVSKRRLFFAKDIIIILVFIIEIIFRIIRVFFLLSS